MTTKKTPPKYLRLHLHLDENTARQVRLQAHKWGLNDTQTVKQLIRLGLNPVANPGAPEWDEAALHRAVAKAIMPLREVGLEALFLNKVVVADRRPAFLEQARQMTEEALKEINF